MTQKELILLVSSDKIYKKVENLHFLHEKRFVDYVTNEKYKALMKEILAMIQLEKAKN